MSTEVQHGPDPQWKSQVSGEYVCVVRGHYTTTPGLAAAGVERWEFDSDRPIKRQAELLALRTAFKDWFTRTLWELRQSIPRDEQIGNWEDVPEPSDLPDDMTR